MALTLDTDNSEVSLQARFDRDRAKELSLVVYAKIAKENKREEAKNCVNALVEEINKIELDYAGAEEHLKNQIKSLQDVLIRNYLENKSENELAIKKANRFIHFDVTTEYLRGNISRAELKDRLHYDNITDLHRSFLDTVRNKVSNNTTEKLEIESAINDYRNKVITYILAGAIDLDLLKEDDQSSEEQKFIQKASVNKIQQTINEMQEYGSKLDKNGISKGADIVKLANKFTTLSRDHNYILLGRLVEQEHRDAEKHRNSGLVRFLAAIANAIFALTVIFPIILKSTKGTWTPFGVFSTRRQELMENVNAAMKEEVESQQRQLRC